MGKWKCRTVLVVIPLYGLKEEMEDMIMRHEYVAGEKMIFILKIVKEKVF